MNFRHPVLLTLLIALVLVLVGLYMVERQRAITPTGSSVSWETPGAYIEHETTFVAPEDTLPNDVSSADTSPETLSIPTVATSTARKPAQTSGDTFDYNAMLAQMRRSTAVPSEQAESTFEQLMGAFSFSPTIAAPTPKIKTPEQQAIYAYGNVMGSRLQAFVAVNGNMTQTLTNQINDRSNQSKGDAVRDLGLRYRTLGEGILAISDVPSSFETVHKKFGESYIQLGEALRRVPDASDDQAFVAAITAYNNKAEAYTNAFVSMVTLFSAHEVVFEETDAGSAFSFRR